MTRIDFLYANNFPTLTDDEINTAYTEVTVMFSGVQYLWGVLDKETRDSKRNLLTNLLVAWYLADTNPTALVGVVSNGGMALSSKSIGGTSVSFDGLEAQEGVKQLNSNMFGQKALMMIQSAPERFGVYG